MSPREVPIFFITLLTSDPLMAATISCGLRSGPAAFKNEIVNVLTTTISSRLKLAAESVGEGKHQMTRPMRGSPFGLTEIVSLLEMRLFGVV